MWDERPVMKSTEKNRRMPPFRTGIAEDIYGLIIYHFFPVRKRTAY